MILTAILATDLRGGIGYKGGLPWPKMSRDLRRFRDATMGKVCIVGRKTYETLPPLNGRHLLVLSRSNPRLSTTAMPVWSLDAVLARYASEPEVMVIGGADIYRQLLPRCDRLLLTVVHGEWPADVFFESPTEGFERLSVETHDPDPHTPARLTFSTWARKVA